MATIQTIQGTDVIANSRADINTNFANLNSDKIETSVLDTDTTLAANSDSKIATQKAVKAYVDAGGNPNASTTQRGIVQEATAAQVLSGAATGSSGARLFINPSTISTAFKFGGTGSDGALAITSGTTTIDLGGAMFFKKNYTSISITGTGVLAFSNPHANGTIIVLKSQGAVVLTSSATPMLDGRLLGSGAETDGIGILNSSKAGVRGSNGGAGGGSIVNSGANATGSSLGGVAIMTVTPTSIYRNLPVAVGAGGARNSGGGGAPGVGGGAIIIECAGALNFTTTSGISVAGGAGASNASGGGGGGTFICLYNTLTANTGTVIVTGGAAASNGGGFSGGGAGGNGLSLVVANTEFV